MPSYVRSIVFDWCASSSFPNGERQRAAVDDHNAYSLCHTASLAMGERWAALCIHPKSHVCTNVLFIKCCDRRRVFCLRTHTHTHTPLMAATFLDHYLLFQFRKTSVSPFCIILAIYRKIALFLSNGNFKCKPKQNRFYFLFFFWCNVSCNFQR